MGVKCSNKPQKGKVNSILTAQHISMPNHKHPSNNNPYGAGEQLGKHAKPDVHSATTNIRACAAAEEWAAFAKAEPSLMQPLLPLQLPPLMQPLLPVSLPTVSQPSFTLYPYNPYNYLFLS
jgi:hypothetical protein